ncbi:TonB-dependent receptor [Chitinophagaceae bacterium IBVUCB2]|nr:TonB-dependent receptor [Chitinophagaceae bacterium IBVUCB2]
MQKNIVLLYSLFCCITAFSQQEESDSLLTLDEVTIRAFEQNRKASLTASTVKIIDRNVADMHNKTSFVHAFNTITGVRMEERSPGSYRLNIRGSSLRSPFGVRNTKVYWNDLPFTDPGGNTYFNQFAYNNFSSIEIFKGPAGSMYGAGTGGLILINNLDRWHPGATVEYNTGSYNLHTIFGSARFGSGQNKNQFTYAHNQSDGYRIQTKMRRDNFSWISQLKLSNKQQLTASVLFSDMYYQTPGALTLAEFIANPKAARPAGGGFPSAIDAKAGIYQKNITAGFTNVYAINSSFKNSTTLYGAFTQIKNPAIRNYERRNEPSLGGRTIFRFIKKYGHQKELQFIAGSEFQQGYFNTQVSRNKNGNPDTLQTNDDINYTTYNFFIQGDYNRNNDWIINAGISLNKTKVDFIRLSSYPTSKQSRSYQNELAPKISMRKKITADFSLKATLSRGFSPPTIAELLPSTGLISTELDAEYGWNYELTASYYLLKNRLHIEATAFYFKLNKALVQRRDVSGADFFVNAGDVKQKGIELYTNYLLIKNTISFIDHLNIKASYSRNHFRYGTFIKGVDNFSGKTVPSVPASTFSAVADLQFKNGFYFNLTWYSASRIFLNDANTATADAYHLLGTKIGWTRSLQKKYKLDFFAGADNLLDETYSLGNDINAAANRFYNAAPKRNYYAGVSFQWTRVPKK